MIPLHLVWVAIGISCMVVLFVGWAIVSLGCRQFRYEKEQ